MGKDKPKEFDICWEGPLLQKEIEDKKNRSEDFGIYQFYGFHPVYGEYVLLYIGMTTDGFSARIKEHEFLGPKHVPGCLKPESIRIYLGYVDGLKREDGEKLGDIERLLIFAHSPAWNSKSIRLWWCSQEQDIKILNQGNAKVY